MCSSNPIATRRRVYVVDDEPVLGEMVQAVLEHAGYDPIAFTEPEAALLAIQAEGGCPDLLLTDCVMSGMDGLELIAKTRLACPGIKCVLISGTVNLDYVRRQPTQPDRFISKPYRIDDLLKCVREMLP